MKKRFFRILSALLVLTALLPMTTARADVISEPNDSFVKRHEDECDYQQYRSYLVNSPEGYAALWDSPASSRQRETLANGRSVAGSWLYTDEKGETWLLVESAVNGSWKERGWIRLSECVPALDAVAFNERHFGEYTEYDGSFDEALSRLETVVVWTYPCSGVVAYKNLETRALLDGRSIHSCWRDPEGRVWGYSGYVRGDRNVWICLSDPTGTDIPANPDVLPRLETMYPPAEKVPSPRSGVTGTAIALVAGLAAVTAGLLWFFFARRKKSGK